MPEIVSILPDQAFPRILENAKEHFSQPALDFTFDVIDEVAIPLLKYFCEKTSMPWDDMALKLATDQAVPQLKAEILKYAKEQGALK